MKKLLRDLEIRQKMIDFALNSVIDSMRHRMGLYRMYFNKKKNDRLQTRKTVKRGRVSV